MHEALLTQFIGFTGLYFFDTAATTAGLGKTGKTTSITVKALTFAAPPWYNTYRFVLTFVVGASIVLTLVGRGKVLTRDLWININ